MNNIALKKICLWIFLIFLLVGLGFYAIAHEQLTYRINTTTPASPSGDTGELLAGDVLEQSIITEDDTLLSLSLLLNTYGRINTGTLELSILEGSKSLFETTLDVSSLADNAYTTITPSISQVSDKPLVLRIVSTDGVAGNAVALAVGNSINTGRAEVAIQDIQAAKKNGEKLSGTLCMELATVKSLWFGQYYWWFFAAASLLLAAYLMHLLKCWSNGRSCIGIVFFSAMSRYSFLLRQLVGRDFKTKYKRSALGVFWSFLNPLLTMTVQYVVFSTLFRNNIPNYPVYLLTGIICFSYFNESVNQCMLSITGNANLITKVYVPKYIYPFSKVLSSGINLLLSLIPLMFVAIVTGLRIHVSILLIPFGLICLFMFCLGMGMLLATSMVFFRDTQFLWGVFSMLWMYCTPIFYPESIIPSRFLMFFKLNPLYHIIRFVRTVLISGISPEPKAYLLCIISCAVPLLLGLIAFKKNQDKFVLYV